jgi:type VI secretion system protein ImpA
MASIDIDALLIPLAEIAPCGPDLEYDPEFLRLEEFVRGKPEQEFGDTLIAAVEPDWRALQEQALMLMSRTRDLRVVMHLLRANTHLNGFSGFAEVIGLIHGLLTQYWDHVHPQLDASDHNDPTMRLNALAPLDDINTVLADLRAAHIGDARAGLTVRHVELAIGKVEPNPGESTPQAASLVNAIADANDRTPGLIKALTDVHADVQAIETLIDAQAAGNPAPELRSLRAMTQTLATLARTTASELETNKGAANGATESSITHTTQGNSSLSAINNRDDALKALDRVCDWINRHEPTNPAPLLIRRAQRLMNKNFLDIIRDLAPDGLKDVERIAGVEPE